MKRGLVTFICGLALVAAAPAAAANVIANGTFEGSLAGWAGWNSTLAQASDGSAGPGAALVKGSSTYYSAYTSPRPVGTHPAGVTYTAGGSMRSATPGRSICLFIREWGSSGSVGQTSRCLTSSTAWQAFPTVTYTSKGGTSVEEYVLATGASGESFEIDGMTLDDGTGAPASDTTPPDTTITAGPADGSSTTSTSASFSFSATEAGTFQCSLDGAAFAACSSPQGYSSLAASAHTFQVRATDTAGNVDATPAARSWTVTASAPSDTTPPETTITAGPADGSSTSSTSASFSFASTEAGTFECALDGAAWAACSSPRAYASLAPARHTFLVRAIDAAGNVDASPASRTWDVTAPPPPSGDPDMLFASDLHACTSATGVFPAIANLLSSLDPSGVDPIASLGDESGDKGTAAEFTNCFDPVWSPFKPRTHPALGNHDWTTGNANGYFDYWGAAAGPRNQGWYSYDVGSWHIVVLSSYCGPVGGCGGGSPQVSWLRSDLAAHPSQCTLAYFHHPLFTSSPQPGTSGNTSAFWSVLYQYGADVIVNGHVHLYERFAPQTPSGVASANGIREFVIGTGGGSFVGWSSRAANSQVIDNTTYGVLKMTLHPGSYDWQFERAYGGSFTDSGSSSCH